MPITSTAYYVAQMKQGFSAPFPGAPQYPPMTEDDCLAHANDWKIFLQEREAFLSWNFRQNNIAVRPLNEIDDDPEAYRQIVNQIFAGVAPALVSYPLHVDPPPQVPPNFQHFFANYVANLHEDDHATLTSVEAINERIEHILANKPDNRLAGYVVGRVQSGKTRNYVGLMLKAASKGWNVILVLTSNSTQLGIQTYKRIQSEFEGVGAAAVARCLNSLPQEQDRLPICNNLEHVALNGNFYWGVAIKEISHLNNIKNWLDYNSQYIPDMRILIIDDEADAATPEGVAPDGGWTEAEINRTLENIAQTADDADDDEKIMREVVAGWFRNLFDLELDEYVLSTCLDLLNGINATVIQNSLLNNADLREPLSLTVYTTEDGENRSPVEELNQFFNRGGRANNDGDGLRSRNTFVKLLRSILEFEQTSTAINKAIRTIIDCNPDDQNVPGYTYNFARCAYIGYTATFYACLFNRMPDETPLYPEFVYPLPKSNRYFGLEEIFGTNRSNNNPRMNIIQSLDDTDTLICDNLMAIQVCPNFDGEEFDWESEGFYINHRLEYCRIYRQDPEADDLDIDIGEWSSLKKAIAWAFCTAAARRHYHRANQPDVNDEAALIRHGSREKCWTSMLVNLNTRQDVHETLQTIIRGYLNFRCRLAQRESFKQECQQVWNELTTNLTFDSFEAEFGYAPQSYPEWNDIIADLDYFIETPAHRGIIQINSTAEGQKGATQYEDHGDNREANLNRRENEKLWIICGGNGISRGLTLPGLTVSYFNAISKSSAVDRLTQMGRWFGYRGGYELLPRLWMPLSSIREFKNTAFLEQDFHSKLRRSFEANISPAEGANFITLWYWGRKLSPRAYVIKTLAQSIETSCVSDDISITQADVDSVAQQISNFLSGLENNNYRMVNPNAFCQTYPVWQNIDCELISEFLDGIKDRYPSSSKRMFEGLCLEIQRSIQENTSLSWDVVVGAEWNPDNERTPKYRYQVWPNGWTEAGSPTPHIQGNIAMYSNAMAVKPLYAMIDSAVIHRIDANILPNYKQQILASVRADAANNNDIVKPNVSAALDGATLDNLEEKFDRYVNMLLQNPGPMHSAIHGLIPAQGYRNRSHRDYKLKVYEQGHNMRPTLQIYPIQPPAAANLNPDKPLYAISVYWPGHTPDQFLPAALNDKSVDVSEDQFRNAVREILEDRYFLMPSTELLTRLRAEFGAALDESILKKYAGGNDFYSVCRGKKAGNAYFAHIWATDADTAEKRFKHRVIERIVEYLRDECNGNEKSLDEIFGAIRYESDFCGLLFASGNHTIKHILTPGVLAQTHIVLREGAHQKKFYRYISEE